MDKSLTMNGFTSFCVVVTQAALQPVRICKSIDRSEQFRGRWVAAGLIASLMALAIGPSAAVAKPRNACFELFNICANACTAEKDSYGCTVSCSALYYQCSDPEWQKVQKEKANDGGSRTPGGSRRPRKEAVPDKIEIGAPKTVKPAPGVLSPKVGGTSRLTNAGPAGLGHATTPGATAGSSTGAILTPTGPGQGSVVGGMVPPKATIPSTGDILGTTRNGQGIASGTGGTYGRQSR